MTLSVFEAFIHEEASVSLNRSSLLNLIGVDPFLKRHSGSVRLIPMISHIEIIIVFSVIIVVIFLLALIFRLVRLASRRKTVLEE